MQVQNGPFLSLFFGDDLKKADNLRRTTSPWWMMYRRFCLLIGFFLISDLLIAKDVDSHLNTNVFSDLTIEA
ncbi:MAG: hypothetical protein EB053_07115, partial [Chlamydiae bacterium]|nr:hypothetical protein [Chlamydiota bacterium]